MKLTKLVLSLTCSSITAHVVRTSVSERGLSCHVKGRSFGLFAILVGLICTGAAHAQVFVANSIPIDGTIGEYTTSGATVNGSLISGLSDPQFIAVSGSTLFVTNQSGSISEYTTSGATVNASLVTGLSVPRGIAVSGSNLFVANAGSGTIGEYTTSGATVNASLISGLSIPVGIAVSGSNLFVANAGSGTIGEYTTSGATVNASLVTGLTYPLGIAVSGSDLFVVNSVAGTGGSIGEYTTTGTTVNASLVTGLGSTVGIAVAAQFDAPYGFFTTSSTCTSNGGSAPFSLAGGASVDGYNSANGGSYSSTVQKSLGNIGSNGSVVLSGGASVGGDIYVLNTPVNGKCPLSDVFISGGATYGGHVEISAYNPAVPSIPAAGNTNVSLSGAKRETLAAGSYGNISLSGASSLTLTAPGTFNINCLQLSGGTTLTISPATEPVVLNVSGTSCPGNAPVDFSGGSMENPSGIASNFQINYAGTGKINLSGGASTYLVVNAPNAAVTLSGGSDLFGAIIGNTIAISGGVALHFDSALQ